MVKKKASPAKKAAKSSTTVKRKRTVRSPAKPATKRKQTRAPAKQCEPEIRKRRVRIEYEESVMVGDRDKNRHAGVSVPSVSLPATKSRAKATARTQRPNVLNQPTTPQPTVQVSVNGVDILPGVNTGFLNGNVYGNTEMYRWSGSFPPPILVGGLPTCIRPEDIRVAQGNSVSGSIQSSERRKSDSSEEMADKFQEAMGILSAQGIDAREISNSLSATYSEDLCAVEWAEAAMLWIGMERERKERVERERFQGTVCGANEDEVVEQEIGNLREAMAVSLQEREEQLNAEVPLKQKSFSELTSYFSKSRVLQAVMGVGGWEVLFKGSMKDDFVDLLEHERKCLKWYPCLGTQEYFHLLGERCCKVMGKCMVENSGVEVKKTGQKKGVKKTSTGKREREGGEEIDENKLVHLFGKFVGQETETLVEGFSCKPVVPGGLPDLFQKVQDTLRVTLEVVDLTCSD